MMTRVCRYILIVFFLAGAINQKLTAWAEESTIKQKLVASAEEPLADQNFATLEDAGVTDGTIERPVFEYESSKLRDPFKTYLVKEPEAVLQEDGEVLKPELDLSKLDVQGVIWGGKIPQAIINSQVLTIGDLIEGAEILSIDKKGVTLGFYGAIFDLAAPALKPANTEVNKEE